MAKVKVRIAVAVGADGEWGCSGWPTTNDRDQKEMMNMAAEHADIPGGEARYWLTAELDMPTTEEVAANIEKDKSRSDSAE